MALRRYLDLGQALRIGGGGFGIVLPRLLELFLLGYERRDFGFKFGRQGIGLGIAAFAVSPFVIIELLADLDPLPAFLGDLRGFLFELDGEKVESVAGSG
jgi:hypothetical protein